MQTVSRLSGWLAALNDRIREHIGRDARNLQVGHSYLMKGGQPITDFAEFVRVFAEDILPLLEEYCYEDYAALARILGGALVDESRQRIRYELLERSRREDLIQALLAAIPRAWDVARDSGPDTGGRRRTGGRG